MAASNYTAQENKQLKTLAEMLKREYANPENFYDYDDGPMGGFGNPWAEPISNAYKIKPLPPKQVYPSNYPAVRKLPSLAELINLQPCVDCSSLINPWNFGQLIVRYPSATIPTFVIQCISCLQAMVPMLE